MDSKPTSVLSVDQWKLLWRLNPGIFDAFADMVSDISALMEEDRPNRLFWPGYDMAPQTIRLGMHMAMVG